MDPYETLANHTCTVGLKNIPDAQLPELCQEIREEILEVTSRNGGHLAPNLGVVELTVALHKVFSMPRDKIVWDVAIRPTPIRSSQAGGSRSTPSARAAASAGIPTGRKARTTRSMQGMPAPPFLLLTGWRLRRRSVTSRGM